MRVGDRVQFFGSVPLPEGGFPYRGVAVVLDAGEDNTVTLDGMPDGVEAGDYMCKESEPWFGLQ